ncbi:hypothetical protein CRG98_001817, partial [Punica granatum]
MVTESGEGLVTEKKKRELLQSYGLNPDEFLSDPSPKPRRGKDAPEMGRGSKARTEDSPPPRTTHKLLQ